MSRQKILKQIKARKSHSKFNENILNEKNKNKHFIRLQAFKHRGERKFACNACPRSYGTSNNLKRHIHDSHQELYLEMVRTGKIRKNTKI